MHLNKSYAIVILIVVVLIIGYFYLKCRNTNTMNTNYNSEYFDNIQSNTNNNRNNNLMEMDIPEYGNDLLFGVHNANTPTQTNANDISNLKVDTMMCSPSCCGSQWPVSFDNLLNNEIMANMESADREPYVRTNMMCSNADNGVGCPCIPKSSFNTIANRGQPTYPSELIHNSLLL